MDKLIVVVEPNPKGHKKGYLIRLVLLAVDRSQKILSTIYSPTIKSAAKSVDALYDNLDCEIVDARNFIENETRQVVREN